jgi:hypothetical protein
MTDSIEQYTAPLPEEVPSSSRSSGGCPICANPATADLFQATMMGQYATVYRFCDRCRFLFIASPHWLHEAYREPVSIYDTGILSRNIALARTVGVVIYFLFDWTGRFLDYGGGCGIFTRLMRDMGFDFYWYDPYAPNCLARGFEFDRGMAPLELITSLETFEHFVDPVNELQKMLALSDTVLFSTCLLPARVPRPDEWSYYGLSHGQHVSFYSLTTIQFMAKASGCNLYSDGVSVHVLTRRVLSLRSFRFLLRLSRHGLLGYVRRRMRGKWAGQVNRHVESECAP